MVTPLCNIYRILHEWSFHTKFIKNFIEITTHVIFCLLYDLSKEFLSSLKRTLFQQKSIVVMDVVMTLLVTTESDKTCGHNIIYDMTLSTE